MLGDFRKENTDVSDRVEVLEALREIGRRGDDKIDIAEAALLLAAVDRPGEPLDPYRLQLAELAEQAAPAPRAPIASNCRSRRWLSCWRSNGSCAAMWRTTTIRATPT
ncbi:MAG: hypothetical protein U1E38_07335 [Rhodospirillales bacterium]